MSNLYGLDTFLEYMDKKHLSSSTNKRLLEKPLTEKPLTNITKTSLNVESYETLRNFLREAEGDKHTQRKLGTFKKDKFFPHTSPEGGNPTIGYGHKITHEELQSDLFSRGITSEQADKLFEKDIQRSERKAKHYFDNRFGTKTWNNLDSHRKSMVIEFIFNLGDLNKFPRFTKALVNEDWEKASKEYKRYFKVGRRRRELKRRNKLFYKEFIKPKVSR